MKNDDRRVIRCRVGLAAPALLLSLAAPALAQEERSTAPSLPDSGGEDAPPATRDRMDMLEERIAELGQREGVIFCLENLNTAVDHPGTPFAKAADTLALVAAVDSPHLRLMLDLYHAQIGEGNLVELIKACAPYIGEVQVADVPGRCEPGTGEINYPRIAQALRDIGYVGTVGLEAWASVDSELALQRFRTAFTESR